MENLFSLRDIAGIIEGFTREVDLPFFIHLNGKNVTQAQLRKTVEVTLTENYSFSLDEQLNCVHFFVEEFDVIGKF